MKSRKTSGGESAERDREKQQETARRQTSDRIGWTDESGRGPGKNRSIPEDHEDHEEDLYAVADL